MFGIGRKKRIQEFEDLKTQLKEDSKRRNDEADAERYQNLLFYIRLAHELKAPVVVSNVLFFNKTFVLMTKENYEKLAERDGSYTTDSRDVYHPGNEH